MGIISVAVLGIVVVVFAIQLKSVKPEFGTYLTFAAGFFLFSYTLVKLDDIIGMLSQIQSYININPTYLAAMVKMIGITYVAEFSAGICRDVGYQSIGSQIEIFGKLLILAVGMPIVVALLETVSSLLG